jgi:hypothetical protein
MNDNETLSWLIDPISILIFESTLAVQFNLHMSIYTDYVSYIDSATLTSTTAAAAAMPPIATISIPLTANFHSSIRSLNNARHSTSSVIVLFTLPNAKRANAMIMQLSCSPCCTFAASIYGNKGIRPPMKYPIAIVNAEVKALPAVGGIMLWQVCIRKVRKRCLSSCKLAIRRSRCPIEASGKDLIINGRAGWYEEVSACVSTIRRVSLSVASYASLYSLSVF